MTKHSLPIILSSALLLAACSPQGPITGTEEQKAQKLAQIISTGGTAACKVTNLTDQSTVDFTVSGKKMKVVGSDFGGGKKGTMINDGVYTYIWEEGQTSGFKMKNPTEEEIKKGEEPVEQTANDYDTEQTAAMYDDETKFKMDCASGGVNQSEFVPPTGVNFIDPSQTQQLSPEELQRLYPAPEE